MSLESFVFRLLSESFNIKINKITVVLYGNETRALTLKEEHRLRMFEKRVLRRIRRMKWQKAGENCSEKLHK
jgi:hypothetical protein